MVPTNFYQHYGLATCTPGVPYMYTGTWCSLYVHLVFLTCTPGVPYMYTWCSLHVHPVFLICTPGVPYMYTRCSLYVHLVFLTCTPGVPYMYTWCSFGTCSISLVLLLQDPKRHLEEKIEGVLTANITQSLGAMLDTVVFS